MRTSKMNKINEQFFKTFRITAENFALKVIGYAKCELGCVNK